MSTSTNPQLELAFQYVSQTRRHVYLTGKAGTGKTTFLHRVTAEVAKHLVVVAPTGVAAINAKGQTIHSLFQLPFGLIRPGDTRQKKRRFSKDKVELLNSIDLLIIDEISMVRADVLDGIDEVLRYIRRTEEPFGGVQLLMIGDLHQLPPVVKDEEREELLSLYGTPYFFGSRALERAKLATIELTHIYRQADQQFIELLNRVRNDDLDDAVLARLNERFRPDFDPVEADNFITLTSHNHAANRINDDKLRRLTGQQHDFTAVVTGKFPASMYPNSLDLHFKVGAQVMFNRNDRDKLYYNGKIGKIVAIEGELIKVQCPGEEHIISVSPITWENISYAMDGKTKEVNGTPIGSYTQHPLRLAWAITIHKSQGLTFDKVVIDAADAFAHGQVYVALSRCKTFEGIILRSRIGDRSVKTDRVISNYSATNADNQPTPEDLAADKRAFQLDCLRELFNCQAIHQANAELKRALFEYERSLQSGRPTDYADLDRAITEKAVQPGRKFLPQLNAWGHPQLSLEQKETLTRRLLAAGAYFTSLVREQLLPAAATFHFLTDNQTVREAVQEKLDALRLALFIATKTFAVAKDGFDGAAYTQAKTRAKLSFTGPAKKPSTTARITVPNGVAHPELFKALVAWRQEEADEREVKLYTVVPNSVLVDISNLLPVTEASLGKISKVGPATLSRFGKDLLLMTQEYVRKNDLKPKQVTTANVISLSNSTYQKSFELFQQGCSIAEIAAARKMAESTIEGHLGRFVTEGLLPVEALVVPEVIEELLPFLALNPEAPAGFVHYSFDQRFSYGQIRAVMGHRQWLEKQGKVA
jgi:hypothetical protein